MMVCQRMQRQHLIPKHFIEVMLLHVTVIFTSSVIFCLIYFTCKQCEAEKFNDPLRYFKAMPVG